MSFANGAFKKYGLATVLSIACALSSTLSSAATFTPGSIVVYRVGTGTATLSSTASNAVFLDEYSPSGVLLQSVTLPTAAGSSPLTYPLTASTGATEGLLKRSANGACLTVTGYAAAAGTASIVATTSATVQRSVAFVSATAGVNTTTTLGTTAGSASNIRGAVSKDCTQAWASTNGSGTANKGIWYVGSVGATTSTQIESSPATTQGIDITTVSGGSQQLYASVGGFSKIGTGLPTSAGTTSPLTPFPTADNYRGVAFVQLNSASAGTDTVYVADSSANTIAKYVLSGGAWSAKGSFTTTTVLLPPNNTANASFGTTGLMAVNLGDSEAALYFTDSTTGNIYRVIDSSGVSGSLSSSPSISLFATAAGSPTKAIYLGIALAPEATLPASAPGAVSGVTATSISATGFTANWTAPSTGGAVAFYVVDVSTSSRFATVQQSVLVPAGTTSAAITGLTSNSTNYFRVRAVNSFANAAGANVGAGVDSPSGGVTVVPQVITFGTAPSGITPGGTGLVTATGGASGNPVTFSSLTAGVCSVTADGTVVTGIATGTCTIAADQAGATSGNTYYGAATEATQSFPIGTAPQSINFGAAPSITVGGTGTVTATATSGLAVTFSSATTSVCTIVGSTVTGVATGTCTINANQAGNASFSPAPQASQSFTIGTAPQVITFGALPNLVFGSTTTVSATGGASGNPVTFTSLTTGVCTVSGSTVTDVTAGTCTIAANQAGSSNYSAATQVTQSFTVNLPFTAGSIVAYRVGSGSGTAVGAQANAVFLDEWSATGTLLQSIAMPTTAASGSLTNPLTASSTGSEGLLNRSVDGACLTVPGYTAAVGTAAVITAAGVQRDVAFVSASGIVDTTTTLGTLAGAGSNFRGAITDSCSHVWASTNGTGTANWGIWYATLGATSGTQLYSAVAGQGMAIATVNGTAIAQLFASVGPFDTIGTGLPTSGIQTATPLAVSNGSVTTLPDNYRGVAFLQLQPGSTGADTLYLADNNASPETVDKYVLLNGVWTASGSFRTASQPVLPSGTSSGTFNTHGLTAVNLGDGEVALYIADSKSGYIYRVIDSSGATGTLTQPAALTLFATSIGAPAVPSTTLPSTVYAVYYGLAPSPEASLPTAAPAAPTGFVASSITSTSVTASWTAPGGVFSYYVVDVSTSSTFTTVQQTLLLPATQTTVNISGLSSGAATDYTNYVRVRAVNSLGASTDLLSGPIAPANTPQTIAFGAAPTITAGSTGTVTATGGASGSPIVFSSLTPPICSVDPASGLVTASSAGICTIAANQAGSGNYLAAAQATQDVTIAAAAVSQSISFGAAPSIVYGTTGTVSATATSGLAVTFTTATPAVCGVSGSTVSGLAAGTCTINADQAGNANFLPAAQKSLTFAIGTAPQVVSFTSLPVVPTGTATGVVAVGTTATVAATGGASGNSIAYSSLTPGICSVSGNIVTASAAGVCTIAADQAGTANYSAAAQVTQSFTFARPLTAFTADNIVISTVFNIDNGGANLDTASPIVLQEFHVAAGNTSATLTGALTLPQTSSGSNSVISGEYGSASEGTLQRSANGIYLTLMGYGVNATAFNTAPVTTYGNAALGQSVSLTAANQTSNPTVTTVPRVVALVGTDTSVDTTTALTGLYNENNPRSAATVDGSFFYTSGQGATKTDPTQGVAYALRGATTATTIDNSTDTRTIAIINNGSANTLYVSRDQKTTSVANVSTLTDASGNLPTSATGLVATQITPPVGNSVVITADTTNGVNTAGSTVYLSPENFFLASPTVMYVADSGAPKKGGAGAGGLQKWVLTNGTWTLAYVLANGLDLVDNSTANAATPTANGVVGLIGLTGKVIDGQVYLYAVSYGLNELSQSYLYAITDTLSYTTSAQAAGEQFSVLYTDPTRQTAIRGVAFAPAIPQAITFGAAPTVLVGGIGAVTATGGASGNPVTFSSATSSVCTVSADGLTVTGVGLGTCTIQADQAGTSSYSAATTATLSFTISGTATQQAVSFGASPVVAVGGTGTLTATGGASGNPVTFTSTTTGICTVSGTNGSIVTGVTAGTCTIAADQAGSSTYAAAPEVTLSFSVSLASQTITFGAAPSLAVGGTGSVSASGGASGNPVTFTASPSSVCTISGSTVTGVGAGTCTITASQAGNAQYAAAPTASLSFSVTGGATAGGDANSADVPLPPWAYALLAIGLFAAMSRQQRIGARRNRNR